MDSYNSSFTSDMDMEQQEAMLVEKYGQLKLKAPAALCKKPSGRKFFDSADWCMKREGKVAPDALLIDYGVPIEQLPVKDKPTPRRELARTNLSETETWREEEPQQQLPQQRTVIDI